ncbi:hypothetical protein ACVGWA_12330, partial [Enterobacter hormaechei]
TKYFFFCGGVVFFYKTKNVGGVGAKMPPVASATSSGFVLAVVGFFFLGFVVVLGRFSKTFSVG